VRFQERILTEKEYRVSTANINTYMRRVNTRISDLLADRSLTPSPEAAEWFRATGGDEPEAVNKWAAIDFQLGRAPAGDTAPVNNWKAWQEKLAGDIASFRQDPRPANPDGVAWDWFGDAGPTGFVGDAPPEVIHWVIAHLPVLVEI
jgi:hypothetical protein